MMEVSTITGQVRNHFGYSAVLGNGRRVDVYLPPGYESHPERRYPVLYVNDGQNVFDSDRAFLGREWELDETAERLIRARQMQDAILVGVDNTPDRKDEYTPVFDPGEGRGGRVDAYGDFLVNELKPFIDANYRTLPDSAHTGIMGSSLGGLCALYLGWTRPETFGMVGALSPSLWWAGRYLSAFVRESPQQHGPQRIWIDMGDQEMTRDTNPANGVPDGLDHLRELKTALTDKGYVPGRDLFYREVAGGEHDETWWRARSSDVLTALYPPVCAA
ncbi:MAG: esterase family protein [Armatimonadetes bacterium]|nr:esterase family protein [Armatimonadota bacterium]